MKTIRNRALRAFPALVAVALAAGAAGCDSEDDGPFGPGRDFDGFEPLDVAAEYQWVLEGWRGVQPVGQPSVVVTWSLPEEWDGEPFRVYGKQASRNDYTLIATVTSCGDGDCRYVDLNVSPGQAYDYFVATEFRNGSEEPSVGVSAEVPSASTPDTPGPPRVTALDGALYLQWEGTGAERYRIFGERIDGDSTFFIVGETDGTGYLDERAENGVAYSYRIAAIDTLGHVSARGALGTGIARPDYHAEIVYALADSAAASGFRFQPSEADSPILAGDAGGAQWRLEVVDGVPTIRPLGSATMTRGAFTTALTCGPGAESDCEAIDVAPAASAFSAAPDAARTGDTYVFRVTGDDGRTHYGKIRVQGTGRDGDGRTFVVFDWAYQLRADEPSLNRG